LKAPQNILTKKTFLLLIIAGVAALFVIIGFSYRSWQAETDPNEVLRNTIAQAIEENILKLSCAHLIWTSEHKSFGQWSNKPQTTGQHQLWWNNNRTAISYKTCTKSQDPNGQVSSKEESTLITHDGKVYRVAEMPTGSTGKVEMVISKKRPYQFRRNNYLQRVGWQGRSRLTDVSKGNEPGLERWLVEDQKRIKRTFHNTRTGQVGIKIYDIENAYGLITLENYAKDNRLQSRTTVQHMQISGGAWFPVSVVRDGYNIQNGELLYQHKMELDIDKSVFNDPSAIPEDVFELEIGPNTEVLDLTSLKTKLKMRLNDF
jgi:hypothetical protein